jgi:hypothetical protein
MNSKQGLWAKEKEKKNENNITYEAMATFANL